MDKRRLFTIFIVVFVDLLGFSLILPLLPYYAETFGANPTVTGFLVASYALAQLIGAPLLGRLSDPDWPPAGFAREHFSDIPRISSCSAWRARCGCCSPRA